MCPLVHTSMRCYDKHAGLRLLSSRSPVFAVLAHCMLVVISRSHVLVTSTRPHTRVLALHSYWMVSYSRVLRVPVRLPWVAIRVLAFSLASHSLARVTLPVNCTVHVHVLVHDQVWEQGLALRSQTAVHHSTKIQYCSLGT